MTAIMLAAATRSIPRTTGNAAPRYAPWWSRKIGDMIKKRKKAWKILRRTRKEDSEWAKRNETFRKLRYEAKTAIEEAKRKSWDDFKASFNPQTPSSIVWKNFHKITGRTALKPTRINHNETLIEDPNTIASLFADRFEANFTPNHPDQPQTVSISPPISIPANPEMETEFSYSELRTALKKCNSKSVGPDNLPYLFFKNLPWEWHILLLKLFNKLWINGTYPEEWKKSIIIPIPKPGEKKHQIDSFRPISLTSCMGKIFERLINQRLQNHLETGFLNENQHAFRKGKGATSYLASLGSALAKHKEENQHTEHVSLDLAKAFDNTKSDEILLALAETGVGNRTYQVIRSFLQNRRFEVALGGKVSTTRRQTSGVPQGSVLSPTLFILVMNTLFKRIPNEIQIILYADDILIVCCDKATGKCRKKAQQATKIVAKWAMALAQSTRKTFEVGRTVKEILKEDEAGSMYRMVKRSSEATDDTYTTRSAYE